MKKILISFWLLAGLATLLSTGCGSQISPANPLLVPPPTMTPSPTPAPTPCVLTTALFRVNCGDLAFTDSCGNVWAADQAYAPGSWGFAAAGSLGGPGTVAIGNTIDDPLFYKERYAATLEYRFDVPVGTYNVWLLFSEGYWTNVGKRKFSVTVEGVVVTSSLDIFAVAGAKSAYSLTVPVSVTDGTLNIVMVATADNALINAIEVK